MHCLPIHGTCTLKTDTLFYLSQADLPTVKDNSASPFFAVAKQIGDKRATVAEQAFGKPFAKVTVMKCGVVAKNSLQLETTEAVADDAPIAASD